jgi:hypothetical protein
MADELPSDPPLTREQALIAASLSPALVDKIDAELLSHARPQPRKIAMLVGLAMTNPHLRIPGLPDLFYAERVRALVSKGLLLSEGNINCMAYSEVRLPCS